MNGGVTAFTARGASRPAAGPDALLAIAHGSRDPRHAAALHALLGAVSAARPDLLVGLGFLGLCGPSVPAQLARLAARGARSVAVVPLFLAHGYHVRHDVPAVLAEAAGQLRRPPRLSVTPPLGPDPSLIDALGRKLRESGADGTGTAVILASAGSSDPTARAEVQRVARAWRARERRAVSCAYASAGGPTTAQEISALRSRGAGRIAVASYFLAPGFLPDRVEADAHRAAVPVAAPFTCADHAPAAELVDLVLARHAGTGRGREASAAA